MCFFLDPTSLGLWASWTCMSISFARLGKFSYIILSSNFSISCSSSPPFDTPIIQMLECLKLSQRFFNLSPFFFFLRSCFFIPFWLNVYFFFLFQIVDLSSSFLPVAVGSLYILLCIAFTFSSILQPYSTISVSILITSVLSSVSERLGYLFVAYLFFWSFDLFFHLGHLSLSPRTCYVVRGGALGIRQVRATHVTVLWRSMWGRGQRGNNAACSALTPLSITYSASHKQIGPFWCWFLGGWVCVHSRTCGSLQWTLLWVREFLQPPQCPQIFTARGFEAFFSLHWNPGFHGLSHSTVVPPGLSTHRCWTTQSARYWLTPSSSHCLVTHPLHPICLSPPLLPVWMNVSSLTPWLLDFLLQMLTPSNFTLCPKLWFDTGF